MAQRRVLITGAGSGLGRALALRYAAAGARVACVDIAIERAEETRAMLAGDGHLALRADVADDASMQQLKGSVDAAWGGVDLLFNNAGIASGGAMVDTTMQEWQRLLDINLLGVVRGCLAFLPGMLAAGHGHVVNTASFAGLTGAPSIMSYGVSKAAVVALSEQLRAECVDTGVAVSVLCPAFFQTNLIESWVGNPQLKRFASRMMETSRDSLDVVADRIVAGVARGEFMILPTHAEPMRWRLKRWFPELYFKRLKAMVVQRRRAAQGGG
jgi:NAD(P)-dependent dehydrogenase (short-subunit alcohol dehydrogenase family)